MKAKYFKIQSIIFPVTAILIVLNMLTGCSFYYKIQSSNNITPEQFSAFQNENKYFILHVADTAWHLTNIKVDDSSFYGTLSLLPAVHQKYKTEKGKYKYKGGVTPKGSSYVNENDILNEVHLYVIGDVKITGNIVNGYISSVRQVDVYSKDKAKTNRSWILPPLLTPVAFLCTYMFVVIIYAAATGFSGI